MRMRVKDEEGFGQKFYISEAPQLTSSGWLCGGRFFPLLQIREIFPLLRAIYLTASLLSRVSLVRGSPVFFRWATRVSDHSRMVGPPRTWGWWAIKEPSAIKSADACFSYSHEFPLFFLFFFSYLILFYSIPLLQI